jgi:glycolate oxidase FAD binding subunit
VDLTAFAEEVGAEGPVTIAGLGTRGGAVDGVRAVSAPSGIEWLQADEMTVSCGAGTPVAELVATLGQVGQTISIPPTGTVGGALAVGRSGIRRLGRGPLRDVFLQARYVSSAGAVIKAGGPTVKNVSGFDLCRLLVGSNGTLGFLGDVILRTQPRPEVSRWFAGAADPWQLLAKLYRPASILWNGTTTWVCLEGNPRDVDGQAVLSGLSEVEGPPKLPTVGRWSVARRAPLAHCPSSPGRPGRCLAQRHAQV